MAGTSSVAKLGNMALAACATYANYHVRRQIDRRRVTREQQDDGAMVSTTVKANRAFYDDQHLEKKNVGVTWHPAREK